MNVNFTFFKSNDLKSYLELNSIFLLGSAPTTLKDVSADRAAGGTSPCPP